MTIGRISHARVSTCLAALSAGLTLLVHVGSAHAEDVSATGKGIVGGALLGAELVTVTEAVFHLQSPWAYVIGGAAGAGGVAGSRQDHRLVE